MHVTVIGAGVAGLASALELAERGASVEILERGEQLGSSSCSWLAGGMLAPWCERENAEEAVQTLGRVALDWWPRRFAGTLRRGTLVVAPARDAGELKRFARRTEGHAWVGPQEMAELELDLAGRFGQGLFFAREAHLDPRRALAALAETAAQLGVTIRFGVDADANPIEADAVLDCRGMAARDRLPELRGVRGEMIIVRSAEIELERPVRLLHPRMPLYVVPRERNLFMIGATMIESDRSGPVTVRSALELLGAAYALHPAFGEAEIVELGADLRPAFPDNLPRLVTRGRVTYLNGLFRHGFLLSPAFARRAARYLLSDRLNQEMHDDDHRERRTA